MKIYCQENNNKVKVYYPLNINKYKGYISERLDSYIFNINYKNTLIKKTFNFIYNNKKSKINKYNNIIEFKKDFSIKNNLVLNSYIIKDDYYIVSLNNDKKMIVDIDDLPLVEKYIWRIQNSNKHPTSKIKKTDDFTDIKDKLLMNNINYDFDSIKNNKFISFIRFKYGTFLKNLTFKNKNRYDYRTKNIIIGNPATFFIKNICINTNNKKKVDNLYIVTNSINEECWEVRAKLNNNNIKRQFSFKEYGKIIGKNRAKEFTQKLIDNNYTIL